MNLWIRSQDRDELIKADNIYITTCNEGWAIRSGIALGKYRTQERALEVLDEIEKLLKGNILSHHINKFDIYNGENIKIYEMPKE